LADALLAVAEAFLAGKAAAADDPEIYQVIVHVGTGALTTTPGVPAQAAGVPAETAGVSAETPASPRPVPGHPADPARCHVEDGPAISVSTAQMTGCTAALSWMRHDRGGAEITPDTIIPPWYGERLDLDEAIYICLANARTPQERQDQRDQAEDPGLFRPRKWVIEPADWIRYLHEHTAA